MSAEASGEQQAIAKVAVLGDEVRARLFAYVRRARRPVTRTEAAGQAGVSAKLAAFHLDKLVEAGLLTARSADAGPLRRVGRAPKVYEPAGDVTVNIPQRRHELLAGILADAMAAETDADGDGDAGSVRQAALAAAADRGRTLGAEQRAAERPGRLGVERTLTMACRQLEDVGFEPERTTPTLVRLRNCPFHPLAARQPDLVCGINQAFLAGYLDGLQAPADAGAVLAPTADACCVELRSVREDGGGSGEAAGAAGAAGCDHEHAP